MGWIAILEDRSANSNEDAPRTFALLLPDDAFATTLKPATLRPAENAGFRLEGPVRMTESIPRPGTRLEVNPGPGMGAA